MPLNPPQVGRLSVCSTTVVMRHQLPGAEVTLHKDSRAFSLGSAKSVWEVMKLPSGMNLTRDDRVLATQSLGGETSPFGIPSVVEGTGPTASLPHPHPDSHIYVCAGNVALGGMTPGTNAEILIGGSVVGKALAHEGACIVALSTGVPSSSSAQARANTCGQQPVTVTLPRGDPTPVGESERLPAPAFGSPLMDCVTWLRIDAVVPGATVFLTRGDGSEQKWSFATRSWLVPLVGPLEDGETVRLRQEFDQCRILGIERTGRVERLTLKAPRLASPWCTGRVTVTELMPGATVIFFAADGTELGRSGAAGTTCQFTLIQPHAFALFARQELCGVLSAPSNSVSAGTDPDLVDLTPPRPVIVEPVHACQRRVRVTGQVNGGVVEIWSHVRGMIGWRHAMGSETTVDVPALLDREPIEAHATTCSGQSDKSRVVQATQVAVGTPVIDAPHAGATAVTVHDVAAGAQLDIYVEGRFTTSVIVDADPTEVPVPALAAGRHVRARQYLCGRVGECEDVRVSDVPSTPQPKEGFAKVLLHNCHTEQRTVHVWNLDHTAGTASEIGSLEQDYDDWGTCPSGGDPLEVPLEDGHVHEIVVVDPGAIGCEDQDDPQVVACRRDALVFLGSGTGATFTHVVA
jgi:hypothetical protein